MIASHQVRLRALKQTSSVCQRPGAKLDLIRFFLYTYVLCVCVFYWLPVYTFICLVNVQMLLICNYAYLFLCSRENIFDALHL